MPRLARARLHIRPSHRHRPCSSVAGAQNTGRGDPRATVSAAAAPCAPPDYILAALAPPAGTCPRAARGGQPESPAPPSSARRGGIPALLPAPGPAYASTALGGAVFRVGAAGGKMVSAVSSSFVTAAADRRRPARRAPGTGSCARARAQLYNSICCIPVYSRYHCGCFTPANPAA